MVSATSKITVFIFTFVCVANIIAHAKIPDDFLNLINGVEPIKFIKVGIPGQMYSINGATQKEGWVFYEACFQGETFYIRNCTNSIPGSGPVAPGCIVGASSNQYWHFNGEASSISSKTSKSHEPPQLLAEASIQMVRRGMGLGFPIDFGSFILETNNHFRASGFSGESIVGAFTSFAGNLPKEAQYTIKSFPDGKFQVNYFYDQQNPNIPIRFIVTGFYRGLPVQKLEYLILKYEHGNLPMRTGGIVPESFDVNFDGNENKNINALLSHPKVTLLYSNHGIYLLEAGKITLVKPPNFFEKNGLKGWKSFVILSFFLTIPLFFWLFARAKKATNPLNGLT